MTIVSPRASAIVAEALSWVIYGLHQAGCDRIRYVGYTKRPKRRLSDHLREGRLQRRRYPLYDWIHSVLAAGGQVEMRILERGTADWKEAETRWIAHFGRGRLFNATDGGDSVGQITPESRERARQKLRERVFTPEHRARISAAKKGKRRPDAAKHLRDFMAGKSAVERSAIARKAQAAITPEGRQRLREVAAINTKKRWECMSAEVRAEISQRAKEQMKRVWEQRRTARGRID